MDSNPRPKGRCFPHQAPRISKYVNQAFDHRFQFTLSLATNHNSGELGPFQLRHQDKTLMLLQLTSQIVTDAVPWCMQQCQTRNQFLLMPSIKRPHQRVRRLLIRNIFSCWRCDSIIDGLPSQMAAIYSHYQIHPPYIRWSHGACRVSRTSCSTFGHDYHNVNNSSRRWPFQSLTLTSVWSSPSLMRGREWGYVGRMMNERSRVALRVWGVRSAPSQIGKLDFHTVVVMWAKLLYYFSVDSR